MMNTDIVSGEFDVLNQIIHKYFIIFKMDENGKITYVNKNFEAISGYTKEELIGKTEDFFCYRKNEKGDGKKTIFSSIDKKKIFFGVIKNKKKDGTPFWVKSITFEVSDSLKGKSYISLCIDITDEYELIEKEKFRSILFEILKISLEIGDLKSFFNRVLKYLITIPWLSLEAKGGFMLNQDGELRLISYYNVSDSLVKLCNRVPFGRCLCGKAAEQRKIIYKAHVDEDHENKPEGMKPHGHYNIPIIHGDQLLGVLFLYLKDGHPIDKEEIGFLKELATVLAMVILRFQFENEYQYSIMKLIRTNEEMIRTIKKLDQLEEFIHVYMPSTIQKHVYEVQNVSRKKFDFAIEENYHLLLNINGLIRFSNIFPIQKVYETIQEYYSPIIDVILKYNGEVEQYLEDKVFAIFKDSESALNSAIEIQNSIFRTNQRRQEFFLKPFTFQLALNFGKSFFGVVGSENRRNWMRYSDTIRWLVDMQKKCKKNHILVSEEFYQELKEKFTFSSRMILKRKKDKEYKIYVRYVLKKLDSL